MYSLDDRVVRPQAREEREGGWSGLRSRGSEVEIEGSGRSDP